MRMHHVWSALPYEIGNRTDHARIRRGWVEWPLGVSVEAAECPAPASNSMNWYPIRVQRVFLHRRDQTRRAGSREPRR